MLLGSLLHAAGAAGEICFREVSTEWGLDFRHRHGGRGDFFMIETMGAGIAILDYSGLEAGRAGGVGVSPDYA
ncbi:MAG TPA: hypothetical protein VMT85_00730 [Thermoanaerobaculia bacterium]|nr:hypothetical protein [Thermoanaerobaculia bacterium]